MKKQQFFKAEIKRKVLMCIKMAKKCYNRMTTANVHLIIAARINTIMAECENQVCINQ